MGVVDETGHEHLLIMHMIRYDEVHHGQPAC